MVGLRLRTYPVESETTQVSTACVLGEGLAWYCGILSYLVQQRQQRVLVEL